MKVELRSSREAGETPARKHTAFCTLLVKVKRVTLGDSGEESATDAKWLHFRQRLSLTHSLSPPELASEVRWPRAPEPGYLACLLFRWFI